MSNQNVLVGQATRAEDQNYKIKIVDNDDYIILNTDNYDEVWVDPSSANRTVTLPDPTIARNIYRKIKIKNIGDSSYKIILAPHDAETFNNQGISFSGLEIFLSYASIEVIGDGTNWIKANDPYIHMLDESNITSGSWDLSVNPTTVWALADLSSLVPVGTLALYAFYRIINTDDEGVLLTRDAASVITNAYATITLMTESGAGEGNACPILLKAKNGQFDYAEQGINNEINTFNIQVHGWLL